MKRLTSSEIEKELKQYRWFHSFELSPGISTTGYIDVLDIFQVFGLDDDLTGRRILEIGTWDGYYAFQLEARGASVVAVDIQDPEATGFAFAKRIKNSSVSYVRCSVYELSDTMLERFDCVLFMGVFYHVRNPILALEQIASVTKAGGQLCFEGEYLSHYAEVPNQAKASHRLLSWLLARSSIPVTLFYADAFKRDSYNWFIPNAACLAEWLKATGFHVEQIGPLPGTETSSQSGIARLYDRIKRFVSGDYQRVAGTARKLENSEHRHNEFEIIHRKQQALRCTVCYTADSYFKVRDEEYLRDTGSAKADARIFNAAPVNDRHGWTLRFSPEQQSVVKIPANPAIKRSVAGAFSIEMWFKPMSRTPGYIFDHGGHFGIYWHGPDMPLQIGRHDAIASRRDQWPLGRWYHAVIAADGCRGVSLYVDGQRDSENQLNAKPGPVAGEARIGASVDDDRYFDGFIDEFRLYDVCLSAQQVSSLTQKRNA